MLSNGSGRNERVEKKNWKKREEKKTVCYNVCFVYTSRTRFAKSGTLTLL